MGSSEKEISSLWLEITGHDIQRLWNYWIYSNNESFTQKEIFFRKCQVDVIILYIIIGWDTEGR